MNKRTKIARNKHDVWSADLVWVVFEEINERFYPHSVHERRGKALAQVKFIRSGGDNAMARPFVSRPAKRRARR